MGRTGRRNLFPSSRGSPLCRFISLLLAATTAISVHGFLPSRPFRFGKGALSSLLLSEQRRSTIQHSQSFVLFSTEQVPQEPYNMDQKVGELIHWIEEKRAKEKDDVKFHDELNARLTNLCDSSGGRNSTVPVAQLTPEARDAKRPKLEDKQPPATLKAMALYIIEKFPSDSKELSRFAVSVTTADDEGKTLKFAKFGNSKEQFKQTLQEHDVKSFDFIIFGNKLYQKDSDLVQALEEVNGMICTPYDIVKELDQIFDDTEIRGDEDVPEYDADFVESVDNRHSNVYFPLSDLSKASALVVTGESGSGKTWFGKYHFRKRFGRSECAQIYITMGDNTAKMASNIMKDSNETSSACQVALNQLDSLGKADSEVYHAIYDFLSRSDETRKMKPKEFFNKMISEKLQDAPTAAGWWKGYAKPVEKLVIVIDDIGKAPEFARGLVEEVREIYCDIVGRRQLADEVLLILVGSGLELYIRNDYLERDARRNEGKSVPSCLSFIGTDPYKGKVVLLKGPSLKMDTICGIPTNDIRRGIISRVLATNTRMLTRGIIPVLKGILTELVPEEDLPARRVALGSYNLLMDYATGMYTHFNALGRLDPAHCETVLLLQFRLLLCGSLRREHYQSNPVFGEIFKELCPTDEDTDVLLKFGLVTADIRNTSNALRYLACGGRKFPLDARDGMAFEFILQHHLLRLSQARHDCRTQSMQESTLLGDKDTADESNIKGYFCGEYDLLQAWPPSTFIGSERLGTLRVIKNELRETGCNGGKSSDVDAIADLVGGRAEFDVVMRQSVSNVQGADVLVLSKENGDVHLDMYHAMHHGGIESPDSASASEAFSSLGVAILQEGQIETQPDTGSAGYTYHGTMRFVKLLEKKLNTTVQIRNRVLVCSAKWQAFPVSWDSFVNGVHEKKVMVWPREMVEPTISALEFKAET